MSHSVTDARFADNGDVVAAAPIPLSALQHAVYCLRQAALIHLERMWVDNRFTAEGDVLHLTTDKAAGRRVKGVRRETALPVASTRLGIAGVADVVEFRLQGGREVAYPVEYKRGKPKLHRADEVQLCAQALCLEEMTETAVPEGALFYGETRRRVVVPFDDELRDLTERTITVLGDVPTSGKTPAPTAQKSRCRGCSLVELCRPKAVVKSARVWRRRALADLLSETPAP